MKQIVPSIIWIVSIVVWLVMVLCTGCTRALRAVAARLLNAAALRKPSAAEHESKAPGCRGC